MKNQLFRLLTTLFIGGALLLPMSVKAAAVLAVPVSAKNISIEVQIPCVATNGQTATTAKSCDGPIIESNVSWNSGGG